MKKRLLKIVLVGVLVGTVLVSALGAGLAGGFGLALPDGSRYVVQFQLQIEHVPAPTPEPARILQLDPSERT